MKRKVDMLKVLNNIGGEPVDGTYEEGIKDVLWWILEETGDGDFRYSKNRNKKDETKE